MKKGLKLKICGMRDPENILSVASLRPDFMGFIFYEKSPRYVGPSFQMPDNFPASVRKVGVFVNSRNGLILELANRYELDVIQLHGSESPEQCKEIQQAGLGVIKAFGVSNDFDIKMLRDFEDSVNYFLFDTGGPTYGGHGRVFDWNLLSAYESEIPFFLSGGLSPGNLSVIGTFELAKLIGVDLNSGVERAVAIKDVELIKKAKGILLHE